jgi:hypothetical protein
LLQTNRARRPREGHYVAAAGGAGMASAPCPTLEGALMRYLCVGFLSVVLVVVFTWPCWLLIDPSANTSQGSRSGDPLDEQLRYLHWSYKYRERTTREVAAGNMSLLEGAAHFAAVEALGPPNLPPRYFCYPGDTVEERLCRHVIRFVEIMLLNDPQREAVVQQLERELSAHLARGPLRLPDQPLLR